MLLFALEVEAGVAAAILAEGVDVANGRATGVGTIVELGLGGGISS